MRFDRFCVFSAPWRVFPFSSPWRFFLTLSLSYSLSFALCLVHSIFLCHSLFLFHAPSLSLLWNDENLSILIHILGFLNSSPVIQKKLLNSNSTWKAFHLKKHANPPEKPIFSKQDLSFPLHLTFKRKKRKGKKNSCICAKKKVTFNHNIFITMFKIASDLPHKNMAGKNNKKLKNIFLKDINIHVYQGMI